MAVSATISGSATVGGLMSTVGIADGVETLTAYEWQSSDSQGGSFSAIAGATSQTYTVAASLRCRWIRCRIQFDDSGDTVYATSSAVRVGPCGGGHNSKGSTAKAVMQTAEEANAPAIPMAASNVGVVKKLRRVMKADTSKFVRRGY